MTSRLLATHMDDPASDPRDTRQNNHVHRSRPLLADSALEGRCLPKPELVHATGKAVMNASK